MTILPKGLSPCSMSKYTCINSRISQEFCNKQLLQRTNLVCDLWSLSRLSGLSHEQKGRGENEEERDDYPLEICHGEEHGPTLKTRDRRTQSEEMTTTSTMALRFVPYLGVSGGPSDSVGSQDHHWSGHLLALKLSTGSLLRLIQHKKVYHIHASAPERAFFHPRW